LHKARIPAERVDNIADLTNNPQVKARELIVYVDHPRVGEIPLPGVLPKLSMNPGSLDSPAPQIGEHNVAIYHDMLGIGRKELSALESKGVI